MLSGRLECKASSQTLQIKQYPWRGCAAAVFKEYPVNKQKERHNLDNTSVKLLGSSKKKV